MANLMDRLPLQSRSPEETTEKSTDGSTDHATYIKTDESEQLSMIRDAL